MGTVVEVRLRAETSTDGQRQDGAAAEPPASAWRPLRHALFRWLWIASVASNVGTWLQNVGASWLMTSLTTSAALVALVQAATSLPSFVLSLPAGALADVLDRRRLLLFTQGWMAVAALGLSLTTLAHVTTPWLLLAFTALLGVGSAMNGPAWQAITPELVSRDDLPAAVSLSSIGFNIARALGPALGGLIVARVGAGWTFVLNGLSFVGVMAVLFAWKRPVEEAVLPGERFLGAMRTGLFYVRHSPEVLAVIVRGSSFVFCGGALWALLPIVAKSLNHGPGGYGILLAALGIGAVAGAMMLPRINRRTTASRVVAVATFAFAAGTLSLAYVHEFWLLVAAMLVAGGAWLSLLSSLNVAIQTIVPSWVRARALSVYLVVFYGGLTAGSALWGLIAEHASVRSALAIASAGMIAGLLYTSRYPLRTGIGLNLAPSRQYPAPMVSYDLAPDRGPVLITVQYRVRPEQAREFTAAMRDLRRIRLRDGAMQWGLYVDSADPEIYTEMFMSRSWLEYLRERGRATFADEEIREQARAFHADPAPPVVRRLIAEPLPRER